MMEINMDSFFYYDSLLTAEQLLISQIIERREILWLCHFTPRNNLENILNFGLKTRNLLQNNEDVIFTDPIRYDPNKDAICLSISKPNSWMFKKKQQEGLDLCLLLLNPSVLYEKKCLFYPHNAATACYRHIDPINFSGKQALENLFDDIITYQKSNELPRNIHRDTSLYDCETTSEQAEVQCLENIEPKYIDFIIDDDNIPLTFKEIADSPF